jgi:predicted patatin/cPLA2 family phospholipase
MRDQTNKNVHMAEQSKKLVEKTDHATELKLFLKEVKELQDKIKRKEDNRNEAKNYFEVLEDVGPQEEIIIPLGLRPFMSKEVNFDLFLEMLTEKVDQ